MKIGVNTLFLVPGDVGGTEIFLRKTLEAIAATQTDVELVLFTTADNDAVLRDDLKAYPHVEFVLLNFRAACRPVRILAEQTLLPLRVKRANVDVLWSPGYTAPRYCFCPQVVTIPDLQYKTHPEDIGWLSRLVTDRLVRSACKRCDAIITISEFSKDEVVNFGFAAADKVYPVHLGVDASFGERVEFEQVGDTQQLACLGNRPYILCVAHTYPHKNVHLLVEAYAQIQADVPYDLVLVGKARRGESVVHAALSRVQDQARVHRLQGLSFSGIQYLFQNAEIFVLPSGYEGFGLPVLEAMMAGTQVITTKQASLPEIGADTVVYVKELSAQGIVESLQAVMDMHADGKKNLLHAGRLRAKAFTWEKCAQGTVDVARAVSLVL